MYDIRMPAVFGSCSGTKSGILSIRELSMDQARWSCAVADLDGFHFLPLTFFMNNAPKSSNFVVGNISNEALVCG